MVGKGDKDMDMRRQTHGQMIAGAGIKCRADACTKQDRSVTSKCPFSEELPAHLEGSPR